MLAIRAVVLKEFVLGIKLNASDYVDDAEDTEQDRALDHVRTIAGWGFVDPIANSIASATFGVINAGKVRMADMGSECTVLCHAVHIADLFQPRFCNHLRIWCTIHTRASGDKTWLSVVAGVTPIIQL